MVVEICCVELWHLMMEQDKLQAYLPVMVMEGRSNGAWASLEYLLFENKIEN